MKGLGRKIIRGIMAGGLVIICLATIGNITGQIRSVIMAEKRNKQVEEEIKRLENENTYLQAKIEYSKTDLFWQEAKRQYFGVGGKDDYWLDLPDLGENEREKEEVKVANYQAWIDLFTKGM